MASEKRFYFFRHGETEWNVLGKFQGHTDTDLNENGLAQASALATACEDLGLELIVSSDLKRASVTAKIVADHLDIPCRTSPAFREVLMGEAEGRTYSENLAALGEEMMSMWFEIDPYDDASHLLSYPGGESRRAMYDRFERGVRELIEDPATPDVVGIASHGGAIRIFLSLTFPDKLAEVRHIPNAALFGIRLDAAGEWHFEGRAHEGG